MAKFTNLHYVIICISVRNDWEHADAHEHGGETGEDVKVCVEELYQEFLGTPNEGCMLLVSDGTATYKLSTGLCALGSSKEDSEAPLRALEIQGT